MGAHTLITGVTSLLVAIIVASLARDKKRQDHRDDRITHISERLARVESTVVTQKDLAVIIKEFQRSLEGIQQDITEIKVNLARKHTSKGE
jgi:hypothetical protein